MKSDDYAIQARVRRTLTRRWIRTDCLDVGTTEGVVLLKGRLETGHSNGRATDEHWDQTVIELTAALRAIPGVVAVVMDLNPRP